MEERARGRRPVGGELPVCSKTAICKAQRVRTMGACRNCAVYSLRNAVAPKKSRLDALLSQSPGCKDLYARLCHNKSDPDAWLIDIYVYFAGGCVADVYTGKKVEPKLDDLAHAKQLFSVVGLTCLMFNNMSPSHASFRFIEDLLFCKRHKPVLTSWGLKKMCQAVCRACEPDPNNLQTMERIVDVKHAIIAQSAVMNNDVSLKRQFNDWCTNFLKLDNQLPPTPTSTQNVAPKDPSQSQTLTLNQTPSQNLLSQTPLQSTGVPQGQPTSQATKRPRRLAHVGASPNQSESQESNAQNVARVDTQSLQLSDECLADQPSVSQLQTIGQGVSLQQEFAAEVVGQTKAPTINPKGGSLTKRHACPTSLRTSKRVCRQP
jgi:hypothetical protein